MSNVTFPRSIYICAFDVSQWLPVQTFVKFDRILLNVHLFSKSGPISFVNHDSACNSRSIIGFVSTELFP